MRERNCSPDRNSSNYGQSVYVRASVKVEKGQSYRSPLIRMRQRQWSSEQRDVCGSWKFRSPHRRCCLRRRRLKTHRKQIHPSEQYVSGWKWETMTTHFWYHARVSSAHRSLGSSKTGQCVQKTFRSQICRPWPSRARWITFYAPKSHISRY